MFINVTTTGYPEGPVGVVENAVAWLSHALAPLMGWFSDQSTDAKASILGSYLVVCIITALRRSARTGESKLLAIGRGVFSTPFVGLRFGLSKLATGLCFAARAITFADRRANPVNDQYSVAESLQELSTRFAALERSMVDGDKRVVDWMKSLSDKQLGALRMHSDALEKIAAHSAFTRERIANM